jgi:hypothetical protein
MLGGSAHIVVSRICTRACASRACALRACELRAYACMYWDLVC